jgi:hypothetical protein
MKTEKREREKLHVGRDVGCCMLHVALLHEKSPIEKPTDYPSASPPPKKNRNGFCHNNKRNLAETAEPQQNCNKPAPGTQKKQSSHHPHLTPTGSSQS